MTSSSAYSNVLLTTPAQPKVAAAPKRDLQSDTARPDFQQAFKNVQDTGVREKDWRVKDTRDSSRRQDEKLAKASIDKAAAANNRKPVKDASPKEELADTSASAEQAGASEKVCTKDKSTNTKTAGSKALKKTNETIEDVANAVATATLITPTDTNLSTSLTPVAVVTTDVGSEVTEPSADSLTLDATNTLVADALKTTLEPQGIAETDTTVDSNKESTSDNSQAQAITQEILAQTTALQTTSNNTVARAQADADTTEQAPVVLPAAIKTAIPATTTLPETTISADVESVAGDLLNSEKPATKSLASDIDVAAKPETTPLQTPVVEAKSPFEKMLQSVTRSAGMTQDERALNSAATSNSNAPASATTADSLFRVNDVQAPAARSFVVQTAVPVPVGQPQWSQAVGEKVLWLAAQNVQSAEINLHPKDLGPIQVKVSVNQEQASVSFTSHHSVVREVLDQNLNRLRDMFTDQGLNLVNVDVSDKSFSRQQGEGKEQKGQGANNAVEEEAPVAVSAIVQQRLVDHYA